MKTITSAPLERVILQDLIDDTYAADETKFLVLCDAGNGSSFGEAGQTMVYGPSEAETYGHLAMRPTADHRADDGTECGYASEWVDGESGYRFQVRF
ncbi:MAG: hypothetical protein VW518_02175 [Burkholderiaceae bacterium]